MERRNFLKASAAGVAGLMLPSGLVKGAEITAAPAASGRTVRKGASDMMKKMKIAFMKKNFLGIKNFQLMF